MKRARKACFPVDDAVTAIDRDIAEHASIIATHQTAILALKTQRNILASISKLPNDILSLIFVSVKQNKSTKKRKWYAVSQVCTHWRDVALDCASLWTDPSFTSSCGWMEIMLTRSKLASLTINSNLYGEDINEYYTPKILQLSRHAFRIKHLSLHFWNPVEISYLDILTACSPSLEKLCLTGTQSSLCCVPSELLAEARRLHTLELRFCTFNLRVWKIYCPLSNVTRLYLADSTDLKGRLLTIDLLIPVLQSMHTLEHLILLRVIAPPSNQLRHTTSLPHLKELAITSSVYAVNSFFKSVTFPTAGKRVSIDMTDQVDGMQEYTHQELQEVLRNIAQLYSKEQLPAFRTLILVNDTSKAKILMLSDLYHHTVSVSALPEYCRGKFLSIILPHGGHDIMSNTSVGLVDRLLASGLPFDGISCLILTGYEAIDETYTPQSLANICTRLPALSHIATWSIYANQILSALQMQNAGYTSMNSNHGQNVGLTNLKTVYIECPAGGCYTLDPIILVTCLTHICDSTHPVKLEKMWLDGFSNSEEIVNMIRERSAQLEKPIYSTITFIGHR